MEVNIDANSGFCFGVVYAIQMAEDELAGGGKLYCLGDIVHNNMEVDRLRAKGLEIITHEQLSQLRDVKVLIRAHGEPPSTYLIAAENNIELVDASCPVVLKLQNRVRQGFETSENDGGQLVIFGKEGHAEVNGLVGQTKGKAIVVMTEEDLDKIDYTRPIRLFSQTTKSTKGFSNLVLQIEKRIKQAGGDPNMLFESNDTLCRQVSNREPQLRNFALKHDVVIFVSGKKSSNGKALFDTCKAENERSYFISEASELSPEWFTDAQTVGICGATSTPMWLMENVKKVIEKINTDLTLSDSHP
ncbi:MAG: 4-hydroxy-3-methylbut-2-enyl diphosphate reductase [Bacteroidia bacterium]|nr:4-hydroxy-3-methylbut-2-enyl diphosphate reductase [Bacteroidia bacterium]MCZ2249200.1 4-hydroxy-3-methylbut-2-enyl diphosphate reductase [Bacteroidia bacterium]